MKKIYFRLKNLPIVVKLNQKPYMPVIWLSLLMFVLAYLFPLIHINGTWRLAIDFIAINCILSFIIGQKMHQQQLRFYWAFLWPILFCLIVFSSFAIYNYPLALVYLILEVFGMLSGNLYREKRRS